MTVTEIEVHGTCTPQFEPVRAAFAENWPQRGELGAAVSVVIHGEPVVNLWGGWGDPARTQPWESDTLTNVWSTTKPMTALCIHTLIERGGLDPDAPVARYWPEFAAGGKADIPVRWVMSHRAGLAGVTAPVTVADLQDWEKMTSLLAAQEPLWEPGTVSGYHAVTFGYLAGEIVRRMTGLTLGQFFAAEIAAPIMAEVQIGLDADDLPRCSVLAEKQWSPDELVALKQMNGAASPVVKAALANPVLKGAEANDPGWRQAEIPAANGHATALGLAAIFGALVDGSERLIAARTLETACAGQGRCTDLVLRVPLEFSLGFALSGPEGHFGPNPATFGHDGFGGSAVCADPARGVSFAYVMNQMGGALADDPRKMALLNALYQSLD